MNKKPHMLIILDGFGYKADESYNAIYHGHAHNFNQWMNEYPSCLLKSYGIHVGLLKGMIGNSEVGHLTIGSGRIIKQPVAQLHEALENRSFFHYPLLIQRFQELVRTRKRLHLMGLLSDAGDHSHDEHLFAFLEMAVNHGIQDIIVHPFLDGRDVPPQSAALYLTKLEYVLKNLNTGKIGTMHGRFYAMDRDNRWSRIEKTYRVLTSTQDIIFTSWKEALNSSYTQGVTDEFFVPLTLLPEAHIKPGDAIIFFNFRADRARELTQALIDPTFSFFERKDLELSWMITATRYNPNFQVDVLLPQPIVTNTLFDNLENANKRIFTIAETEKYAHVTYFFNGGREIVHRDETRILIPSKRHYKTYADIPTMSAPEITDAVLTSLTTDPHEFYLINYANADMVGHSGNFEATCKAVECLDQQLKRLYDLIVEQLDGTMYITADHGKAEDMYDEQMEQPRTAHTKNKVPFLFINKAFKNKKINLELIELSDIAPFILEQLHLPIPSSMQQIL